MRHEWTRGLVGMIAGLALVLAGCGDATEEGIEAAIEAAIEEEGGTANVDIDTADGEQSVHIETDEGSIDISASQGDVPDGFPLPIAGGCKVIASSTIEAPDGTMMSVTLEMPADEAPAVAEFYEKEFEKLGMMVSRMSGQDASQEAIVLTGVDSSGGDRSAHLWLEISGDTATGGLTIGGAS